MLTKATRDQFDFEGDLKVRHRPTGATFSTYRYENPDHACSTVTENLEHAGDRLQTGEDFSPAEIRAVAIELLRERAKATARKH